MEKRKCFGCGHSYLLSWNPEDLINIILKEFWTGQPKMYLLCPDCTIPNVINKIKKERKVEKENKNVE